MLILIEDSERGMDVARGIWGAFNSCLYVEGGHISSWSLEYLIGQCAKSGVSLIVTTDMHEIKDNNKYTFRIYCDGHLGSVNTDTLVFNKDMSRDKIVGSIIAHFKWKKLL